MYKTGQKLSTCNDSGIECSVLCFLSRALFSCQLNGQYPNISTKPQHPNCQTRDISGMRYLTYNMLPDFCISYRDSRGPAEKEPQKY